MMILGISLVSGQGAIASTPQPSTSPALSEAISLSTPSPKDDTANPDGLWWPEVDAYVGCNNTWSYSGAAWDQNRQTLKASSNGFLTTSTFYGTTSNYDSFSATIRLYKDGQEVGHHTSSCGK
jgi:hypothetical protein